MTEAESDKFQVEELRLKLYELQVNNADLIRKAILGYKPVQGTKAWSNDPDYGALLQLFEEAVVSGSGRKKTNKGKKKARKARGGRFLRSGNEESAPIE